MNLEGERPQKSAKAERAREEKGEAPKVARREETPEAGQGPDRSGRTSALMEGVISIPNLQAALKRVEANRGSPGIDGMRAEELRLYLRANWKELTRALLAGTYQPQAVKRCEIPKDNGGVRVLGIPTVLDRFIQQALLQVLQPIIDPTFSNSSFGFRPGRSAHDAIARAREAIQEGRHYVVDVDLEKFFDRVNHDVLMERLARRIEDKRMLRLIRRYLEAGMMANGVVMAREEGTPQGGPLSPLLANVLLDEVDKDLERNGHAFARYADDCNVYVHSKRAGERVMSRLTKLYGQLRLKVNVEKSAVASALQRDFLGFGFWVAPGGRIQVRVAKKAVRKLKERVRKLTRRNNGRSMQQTVETLASYLRGWHGYFRIAQTPRALMPIDQWIRHRLRAIQLKQWKRGRTAYDAARRHGAPHDTAMAIAIHLHRWWQTAGSLANIILPNSYFNDELGLPRLGH
jgi:group II intron reverse transcriptase/maturase